MKTWLITGTSSGFGKELATLVAQQADTQLVATARRLADLDYLDEYDADRLLKVVVDVTDDQTIQTAVVQAQAQFGNVDVLVNNAGLGYFSTIEESDLDQVRYLFDVNVLGLARMTRAVLPLMRAQRQGTIVNLSSALALTTLPTMGFYSATKYAVEGYSDTLRQEVGDFGIQVMTVEPSGARTDWAGRSSVKTIAHIPDYQAFNASITGVDASVTDAPGNPHKIAQAIYQQVTQADPLPHHLPLGEFAYQGGLANLTGLVAELKQHRTTALSTDD